MDKAVVDQLGLVDLVQLDLVPRLVVHHMDSFDLALLDYADSEVAVVVVPYHTYGVELVGSIVDYNSSFAVVVYPFEVSLAFVVALEPDLVASFVQAVVVVVLAEYDSP